MELIPYPQFARLRLKPYAPTDDCYDEDVDEHGQFVKEEIRGIVFARLRKRPNELFIATVDLLDFTTDVGPPFFKDIKLNLEAGLSPKQVEARFGKKPQWKRDDGEYVIYHSDGKSPYEVSCSFDDGRLTQVTVRRLDLEIPKDEGER